MYYEIERYELLLGNASYCSPANFIIPTTKKLVLGFKLLDVAGNASEASEVTIDTTMPVEM